MTIREELTDQLARKVTGDKEGLIESGLPPAYDIKDVARQIYPDGVEIYLYKGEPFLELHPPQFVREDDGSIQKIKVIQNYRRLNSQPEEGKI